jgi:hypothetical protein
VLRVTSKDEVKLKSWDTIKFDTFRDQVLAEEAFGCLLDMIPHRLLKVLAISWNQDKIKESNLNNILQLLYGDTDLALSTISERLHTRDGTADLQQLTVPVGTDVNRAPKAQEWMEKVHLALEMTSSKYSTKDKNSALMIGESSNYPSIKRDFDNLYGSAWCLMDSDELIEKIAKALANIKRSNDAERFNQHKLQVFRKSQEYNKNFDYSS